MKKLILSLYSIALFCTLTKAQSLTTSLGNDTLIVYGFTNDWVIDTSFTVYNISVNTLNVHCRRTSANLAPGDSTHFCWGTQCYGNTTNISTTAVSILAGDSTMSFISDLTPGGNPGISYVSYCFFNVANPSDQTCLTIEYHVEAVTGIKENNLSGDLMLPQPNPSNKYTTMRYSLKGNPEMFQLQVFNLTGSQIATYPLKTKTGSIIMSTEELPSGIYFCSLKQNDSTIATKKLLVSHH